MLKLIIVDDESIFVEYISTAIDWNTYGYELIFTARNGIEALELISMEQPDVALIDIDMPYLNGLELSDVLKEKFPDIAIILITGYSEFEYAKKAVKVGVEDYILKPFDKSELIKTLHKIKEKIQNIKDEKEILNRIMGTMPSKNILVSSEKTIKHSTENKLTRSKKITDSVKKAIEANYSDPDLSVEGIAKNAYINSCYLRKVFKKELNMTVCDYITGIRMSKAKELIESNNIKISYISEMVGYCDSNYFSKCFKKYFGISPSEYECSIR